MACRDEQQNRFVLAENNRIGSVALCGCGTIHLSLGAVSLRLSPEVFGEAVTMMRAAMQNLLHQGRALETTNELVH